MTAPLSNSRQTISEDTSGSTSLQASADGTTPYRCQDTPDLFGQEAVPASRSAWPERAKHQVMNATYGPNGTGLSAQCDRQHSLASKLMRQLDGAGSTLFTLTWKRKATPLGRPYYQLVASARRTSGSDCGSWQTPNARENGGGEYKDHAKAAARFLDKRRNDDLIDAVHMVGWPTPAATDAQNPGTSEDWHTRRGKKGLRLNDHMAHRGPVASWSTPRANDGKSTDLSIARRLAGKPPDTLTGQVKLCNGSPAPTESRGQLNPAFSLWLMGYPAVWLWNAPKHGAIPRFKGSRDDGSLASKPSEGQAMPSSRKSRQSS